MFWQHSDLLMATFELYRRSSIGMCLTETLDEMVSNGTLSPELAIQVLVQFDKVSYIIIPLFPRFYLLSSHIFLLREGKLRQIASSGWLILHWTVKLWACCGKLGLTCLIDRNMKIDSTIECWLWFQCLICLCLGVKLLPLSTECPVQNWYEFFA